MPQLIQESKCRRCFQKIKYYPFAYIKIKSKSKTFIAQEITILQYVQGRDLYNDPSHLQNHDVNKGGAVCTPEV